MAKNAMEKILAKAKKQVAKEASKEDQKRQKLVTLTESACKGLKGITFEPTTSGKTIHIVYSDRKIGVINSCVQASPVVEGRVSYVRVTPKEFAEWAAAICATIDEQEKQS